MYEVGMSKDVEQINKEYAQQNGYNFPPNTQQMINAIVEWIKNHIVRDVKDIVVKSEASTPQGIKYTMQVNYTKGDPTEYSFLAPYGIGIKNIKLIEVVK